MEGVARCPHSYEWGYTDESASRGDRYRYKALIRAKDADTWIEEESLAGWVRLLSITGRSILRARFRLMPGSSLKRYVPKGASRSKAAIQWKLYETLCPITRDAARVVSRATLVASLHVCREPKFVYVDIAKSGSTSFKNGLVRFVTGSDDAEGAHSEARRLFSDISDLPTLKPLTWLIEHEYPFVSIVRNPYDRLASAYRFMSRRYPSQIEDRLGLDLETATFAEFVRAVSDQNDKASNSHWRSQTAQLAFGVIPCAFIGRVEAMHDDWYRAFAAMGVPQDQVPPPVELNRSEGESEWTDELRHLVAARYAADFRNFGYSP